MRAGARLHLGPDVPESVTATGPGCIADDAEALLERPPVLLVGQGFTVRGPRPDGRTRLRAIVPARLGPPPPRRAG